MSKNKLILIFAFTLAFITPVSALDQHSRYDLTQGFRGWKWGTDYRVMVAGGVIFGSMSPPGPGDPPMFFMLKRREIVSMTPPIIKEDRLTMGPFTLRDVEYIFWSTGGRMSYCGACLPVLGKGNVDKVAKFLKERYGKWDELFSGARYRWNLERVRIAVFPDRSGGDYTVVNVYTWGLVQRLKDINDPYKRFQNDKYLGW